MLFVDLFRIKINFDNYYIYFYKLFDVHMLLVYLFGININLNNDTFRNQVLKEPL